MKGCQGPLLEQISAKRFVKYFEMDFTEDSSNAFGTLPPVVTGFSIAMDSAWHHSLSNVTETTLFKASSCGTES